MCLAIPSKVIEIAGKEAIIDLNGVKSKVKLDLLPEEIEIGDYLLVHTGFAIQRIPPEEAEETLQLFDELYEAVQKIDAEGG